MYNFDTAKNNSLFIALNFGILLSCWSQRKSTFFSYSMYVFIFIIFQAVSRGGEQEVPVYVLFKVLMILHQTISWSIKGMRSLP